MITISDFYDESIKISFYGNINPSVKLQGYSKNRTIGGKIKQRWIGEYNTFNVEILVISDSNFNILKEMFSNRSLLNINNDGDEAYATIVGDSLSFTDFEDEDGLIYWRGNLELES